MAETKTKEESLKSVDPARWKIVKDLRTEELKAQTEVSSALLHVKDAKDTLSMKEGKLEKIRQELGDAIDGNPVQMKLPLQESANKQAWRSTRLETLKPKPKTLKALADNEPPIVTLGDLTDWQKKKGDFWAKDIKGIGEAAAEEIADVTFKYWQEHPEQAAPRGLVNWQATLLETICQQTETPFHCVTSLKEVTVNTLGQFSTAAMNEPEVGDSAGKDAPRRVKGVGPKLTAVMVGAIRKWIRSQLPGDVSDVPAWMKT